MIFSLRLKNGLLSIKQGRKNQQQNHLERNQPFVGLHEIRS